MLSRYASPLLSAVALFPAIAGLFTLPFMVHQYRKYGSIPFLRILAIYLFIFYLLCAYFLVILPSKSGLRFSFFIKLHLTLKLLQAV